MDIAFLGRMTGTLLVAALFLPAHAVAPAEHVPLPVTGVKASASVAYDADVIAAELRANGALPIGDIDVLPADGERGLAVFLPQTHIKPGTAPMDPVNDTALLVQREHAAIVRYVTDTYGIGTAVVEGALVDEPVAEEVARLQAATQAAEAVAVGTDALAAELDATAPALASRVRQSGKDFMSQVERTVLLKGAPYAVAAGGADLRLAGAENPETKARSGEILRRYIYQEDRLAQLQGTTALVGATPAAPATLDLAALLRQKLMQRLQQRATDTSQLAALPLPATIGNVPATSGSLGETLQEVQRYGNSAGNEELMAAAEAIAANLHTAEELLQPPAALAAAAPSRADNPYRDITDPAELRGLMAQTKQDIQTVIIDQRNRETADAFVAAIERDGTEAGILQFGLGHTDELAEELRARGISVIIVRSTTVAERFDRDLDPLAEEE